MVDMTLIRPLKSKGFAFWYQSTHRLATIHSVQTDRVIIVILWNLMFHNSVETQLKYSDIFSNRVNIVANFQKKIENWSVFGEDMDKSLRLLFWATL